MTKPKVLFLCTGNSARSQMAEAFLRHFAGDTYEVHSAGLEPKDAILPEVVEAMAERRVNLQGQHPKGVQTYLGRTHFAHVITVCGDAEEKCPTVFLNMGKHEHWPFDDPGKFEGTGAEKRTFTCQVRDRIEERIRRWLEEQEAPLEQQTPKTTNENPVS